MLDNKMPAGALSAGVYTFEVNASHGIRSALATASVTVEQGEPPSVAILVNTRMQAKFDPAQKLALLGSVHVASEAGPTGCDLCNKRWSAEVCASADCAASSSWSAVELSTDGFVLTSLFDLNLVVDNGRLQPGVQYRFRLESWVGGLADGPTGSSVLQITTNAPPSGGVLAVSPASGMAVHDTFTLTASSWVRQS